MADEDKIGRPWNDEELDAIVADYFAMLTAELSGQVFVKSHHSAALMAEIGRTHRSVEFKHQNISAVMEELGLPWIHGYKPKRNYQNAIFDAIDRYLTRTNWLALPTLAQIAAPAETATTDVDVFVSAPAMAAAVERPPRLEHLVRKFDAVERDFRNRSLGKAGEEFVLGVERNRLDRALRQDLVRNIRWVSHEDGDGAGYDILSFEPDGRERLIEVKTTNGAAKTPFFLTRTEYEVSEQRSDAWRLYRVHFFAQSPRIFTIDPPLAQAVHLRAEAWRASFT